MKKKLFLIIMAVVLFVAAMPMPLSAASVAPQSNMVDDIKGAIAPGLYISDYECRMDGETANISFTVWNELGKSASVIVFDEHGNEYSEQHIICDKYTKGINSVKQWAEGGWKWVTRVPSLFDSRQHFKLLAEDTNVNNLVVPENGYVLITNDPSQDPEAFVQDSFDFIGMSLSIVDHTSEALSTRSSFWNSDVISIDMIAKLYDKLPSEVAEEILDETAAEILLEYLNDLTTVGADDIKNAIDYAMDAVGGKAVLYEVLNDIGESSNETLKESLYSVTEAILTNDKLTAGVGTIISGAFATGDYQNIAAWIEGMRTAIDSGSYIIHNNPEAITNSSTNNEIAYDDGLDYYVSYIGTGQGMLVGGAGLAVQQVEVGEYFWVEAHVTGPSWGSELYSVELVFSNGDVEYKSGSYYANYSSGGGKVNCGYYLKDEDGNRHITLYPSGDWTITAYLVDKEGYRITTPGRFATAKLSVVDPAAQVNTVELVNTDNNLRNTTPLYFNATANNDTKAVKFIGDDGYDWGIVSKYKTIDGQRVFTTTREDITYASGTRSMHAFPIVSDTILWDNGAECTPFNILLASDNVPTEVPVQLEPSPTEIPEISVVPSLPSFNPVNQGNTVGNIANEGYAAITSDRIYFCNVAYNGNLYSMKIDGSEQQKLNDDWSRNINVVDNKIYYRNDSDNGKIYTINIDGSGRKKLNDDASQWITIISDRIYYQNSDDNYKIYTMKTDGSGRQKLNDDNTFGFSVVGDRIYYLNSDDYNYLYTIKIDGSDRQKFDNEASFPMSVVDSRIYYANREDGDKIYSMKIDGSDKQNLSDDKTYDMNVTDGRIYYTNIDDDHRIYSISIDGGDAKKLNDDYSRAINVVGDQIYYINQSDNHKLYTIKIDGSDRRAVE